MVRRAQGYRSLWRISESEGLIRRVTALVSFLSFSSLIVSLPFLPNQWFIPASTLTFYCSKSLEIFIVSNWKVRERIISCIRRNWVWRMRHDACPNFTFGICNVSFNLFGTCTNKSRSADTWLRADHDVRCILVISNFLHENGSDNLW